MATTARIALVVTLWVLCSNLFNISSKLISTEPPLVTTMFQFLFAGTMSAGYIRSVRRKSLRPFLTPSPVGATVPIALALVSANGAMMWALTRTSVATFQSIKASSPLFTAFACALFLSRFYTFLSYAFLVPILLGLLLSTGHDETFEVFGFSACVLSAVAQVYVNLSAKALYESRYEDLDGPGTAPRPMEPIEVQMLVSISSFCICLFLVLLTGDLSSHLSLALLANVCLYYCENILAYNANRLMYRLPYAVSDAVRRISIVLLSHTLLGKATTSPTRAMGILLLLFGSIGFAIVVEEKPTFDKNAEHEVGER